MALDVLINRARDLSAPDALDDLCLVGALKCGLGNLLDGVGDTGLDTALGMVRHWIWIIHGTVCVR